MRVLALLLLMVVAAAAGTNAAAQETEGLRLAPAPVNRLDDESLQRGARNFVNYCLNCHSARYMRPITATIRPRVRSPGASTTRTRSPTSTRMKFRLGLPSRCAVISRPSTFTR